MQQILAIWNTLDMKRRAAIVLSVVTMFAAILLMARAVGTPTMALLYSGLDPAVSGKIVGALEQSGVSYRVRGDAIYVDATRRDLTRMSLAEQGLPPSGTVGYELLDGLSGFGTTAQMFDVAYWRAKEGELARTILAWPQVRSARVHIANPRSKPFATPVKPVASVTLKLSGGSLTPSRVRALRFLVASAVAGLSPQDVSVIDADRGLITSDQAGGTGIADARTDAIRKNVERMLAARVGPGNAVVEVSLDTSQQQETLVQHSFDPKSRVAISTDSEETSGNSSGSDGGGVTVASNLPSGSASGSAAKNKSSNSKTRERVNYEVSETTRKLLTRPGTIQRISVAILVNGTTDPATGKWAARSDGELSSLEALAKSAAGFNEKRGDVVTIKSLQFLPLPDAGTTATPSPFQGLVVNAPLILQSSLLAIVILILGLFVVRPALKPDPNRLLPAPDAALPGGAGPNGETPQLTMASLDERATSNDPIAQLREIISTRQEEAVQVLRNWVETSDEGQI